MKVIQSKTICQDCESNLVDEVLRHLAVGWKVSGDPVIDSTGYYQTLIRTTS